MTRWTGSGVAGGTAVAPARRTGGPPPTVIGPIDAARVEQAFHAVAADLTEIAARARSTGRKAAADIVAVGALMATDPALIQAASQAATSPDPLAAITQAIDDQARILESLPDETLRERAADIRQIGRRVVDHLARVPVPDAQAAPADRSTTNRLVSGNGEDVRHGVVEGPGIRHRAGTGADRGVEDLGVSVEDGEDVRQKAAGGPPTQHRPETGVGGGVKEVVGAVAKRPVAERDAGSVIDNEFVLVAEELGPADLLEHLGQGLVAAVTVRGGANSHAAIIARSTGLPLVAGVAPDVLDVPDDTMVLVDADAGVVVARPAYDEIARAGRAATRERERRAALAAERTLPHLTADGHAFTVSCNVATDIEAHAGRVSGAAGIGLLRTELPFLEFDRWPTEADHRRALRPIFAEAAGWPVTLRLLDFANDKIPPFLTGTDAGLDALLGRTDALEAQIRAAVRVGRATRLRIMVPMVTKPDQIRAVRAVVEAVVADAGADDTPASNGSDTAAPVAGAVPVGAMIETLDAVADIAALCEVCDFLSIGTNDLTAQVLDLDRRDPRALPELTAHPRVLEPVGRVVAAADRAGIPVSVCGDSGAHPTTLPLLLGAGVRHLSVACARVDEVRYRVRRLRVDECADLFTEALALTDADEVHELVRLRAETPLP